MGICGSLMDILTTSKLEAQINLHEANFYSQHLVLKTHIIIFFLTSLFNINILS